MSSCRLRDAREELEDSPHSSSDVFRCLQKEFIEHVDLSVLVPLLNQQRLLTESEEQDLTNEGQTLHSRAMNLTVFLRRKGPSCPDKVLHCLQKGTAHTGHTYLVDVMERFLHKHPEPEHRPSESPARSGFVSGKWKHNLNPLGFEDCCPSPLKKRAPTTDCVSSDLDEDFKVTLKSQQPVLVKYIKLNSLIPHLIQQGLLTDDENDVLLNTNYSENDRILKLLLFLERKGNNAFILFLKALEQEKEHLGHHYLVQVLNDAQSPTFQPPPKPSFVSQLDEPQLQADTLKQQSIKSEAYLPSITSQPATLAGSSLEQEHITPIPVSISHSTSPGELEANFPPQESIPRDSTIQSQQQQPMVRSGQVSKLKVAEFSSEACDPISNRDALLQSSNWTLPEMPADKDEWDVPADFSLMFGELVGLFNQSVELGGLKTFLRYYSHPYTRQLYVDRKVFEECSTSGEVLDSLFPHHINFVHTDFLRVLVKHFGCETCKSLLQRYEEQFPRDMPLHRMKYPLSEREIHSGIGMKPLQVKYNRNINDVTKADIEDLQKTLENVTGVDAAGIVFARQKHGCTMVIFLIPEAVAPLFTEFTTEQQIKLSNAGILRVEVGSYESEVEQTDSVTPFFTKSVPIGKEAEALSRNSQLKQLTSRVAEAMVPVVHATEVNDFLKGLSHPLYPECKYIHQKLLANANTVESVVDTLTKNFINFVSLNLLLDIVNKFCPNLASTIEPYAKHFPPSTVLASVPDPVSEEDIAQLSAVSRLQVNRKGDGKNLTLHDVWDVQCALEEASGISKSFLPYAYWESGYNTHQLTFLMPTSAIKILKELSKEDLLLLMDHGILSICVDYDSICADITPAVKEDEPELEGEAEPHYADEIAIQSKSGDGPRNHGLEQWIPEHMRGEQHSHFASLIAGIPESELQETCPDDSLKYFAKKIENIENLTPYLGISQPDMEELVSTYPDKEEQNYQALLHWKKIDLNTATFDTLIGCFLRHGYFEVAEAILNTFESVNPFVVKAQNCLKEKYTQPHSHESLWPDAPKLMEFDRSLAEVSGSGSLRGIDYSRKLEGVASELVSFQIKKQSLKSLLNTIGDRKKRFSLVKGPPSFGKTRLVQRASSYWAKGYALRKFILVLYVDLSAYPVNAPLSLSEVINAQVSSNVDVESVCRWIERKNGRGVLIILDGCQSHHFKYGGLLIKLLRSYYLTQSSVLVTTTSSWYLPEEFRQRCTQLELVGLSDAQIAKQIANFNPEVVSDFLVYLAENPDIRVLVSSPVYLAAALYLLPALLKHSPATWTEFFKLLAMVLLQDCFPEAEKATYSPEIQLGSVSPESEAQDLLEELGKEALEALRKSQNLVQISDSQQSLAVAVPRFLTPLSTPAESEGQKCSFHRFTLPLLQHFLPCFWITRREPDEQATIVKKHGGLPYVWQFFAGCIGSSKSSLLPLLDEYQSNTIAMANCLFEASEVSIEERRTLSKVKLEIRGYFLPEIVTTRDVHHLVHCLPYMCDPHTITFENCFLGVGATRAISFCLGVPAVSAKLCDYSITYLSLRNCRLSGEAAGALAVGLRLNSTLQTLDLSYNEIRDDGISAIASALEVNGSVLELLLNHNQASDCGATALGKTLRINEVLQKLNLSSNRISDSGACGLAKGLETNRTLWNLWLDDNLISDRGVTALAKATEKNHILKQLELAWNPISWETKQKLSKHPLLSKSNMAFW